MNKPIANTAWATDKSAKKVEPLESQRQAGWVYQDTPSSGVINSWMNAAHQWQVYLEQTGDEHEVELVDLRRAVASLEHRVHELTDYVQKIYRLIPKPQA
ncbi:MAG: hypothetical protein WCK49_09605 [Myxococcaceae bacterium]